MSVNDMSNVIYSYEVPEILKIKSNMVLNEMSGYKSSRKNNVFNESTCFPHEDIQTYILSNLDNYYRSTNPNGIDEAFTISSRIPTVSPPHRDIPYLFGYVHAIAYSKDQSKMRLIRINYKHKYKYNDAISNKVSSGQLIELYACMECFDAPEIDLVK